VIRRTTAQAIAGDREICYNQTNMQILTTRDNKQLAAKVVMAGNFWQRLRGWLGVDTPTQGQGLFLFPCQSVHTFGMRFAIDAVYLNDQDVILCVAVLKPWRFGPWVKDCRGVLELPAGSCDAAGCGAGDRVRFVP
jgi:uncharacterized protein